MQTFLPYPDFYQSAHALDYRRLGKQRVECKQLLSALGYEISPDGELTEKEDSKKGWINHPATQMWKGYERSLAEYQAICITAWMTRGYVNNMYYLRSDVGEEIIDPPWLGDERIHSSHRSNLLRKDPEYYVRYDWTEHECIPYQWPVLDGNGGYTLEER